MGHKPIQHFVSVLSSTGNLALVPCRSLTTPSKYMLEVESTTAAQQYAVGSEKHAPT